jgi:putative Flp pilus-assembly TadE/G-like protein
MLRASVTGPRTRSGGRVCPAGAGAPTCWVWPTGSGRQSRPSSSGQVLVLTTFFLVILLAFAGLAVDGASLWFHRQEAQSAADAACQAGAMDLQYLAINGTFPPPPTANPSYTPLPGGGGSCTNGTSFCPPAPPTVFPCAAGSSFVPCQYAAFNGYNGAGLTANVASNEVDVSYPADLTAKGIQTPTGVPVPFMQVLITENVKVSLLSLFTRTSTQSIKAVSICGLTPIEQSVGFVVLDPTNTSATGTGSGAFENNGNPIVNLIGGPKLSIQVDSTFSTSPYAVTNKGGPTVDLSHGYLEIKTCSGTNPPVCTCPGGRFGVTADEANPFGSSLFLGSSGAWVKKNSPISDPWSGVPTPPQPTGVTWPLVTTVSYGWHPDYAGATNTFVYCPDNTGVPCTRFSPGFYANGSTALAAINSISTTAIFDPGFYYIQSGGMAFNSHSLMRPSGASNYPDGMSISTGGSSNMNTYCGNTAGCWLKSTSAPFGYVGGTTFYFAGSGSINAGSASGHVSWSGANLQNIDCFGTFGTNSVSCGNTILTPAETFFSPDECALSPSTCAIGTGPQTNTPAHPLGSVPALRIQLPCNGATGTLPICNGFPIPSSFASHAVLGPCGTVNKPSNPPSSTWVAGSSSFQVESQSIGRGIEFFDAHNNPSPSPQWQGGGQMLAVGAMYFHQCTGPNAPQQCSGVPKDFNDTLQLAGNAGDTTYVFGNIVTDQLAMGGSPTIRLYLDLNYDAKVPKVFLIR